MNVWPQGAWFGLTQRRLRVAIWLIASVSSLACVFGAATIIANRRLARDAQGMLSDVGRLEIGVSPVADIQSLAGKYSRYRAQTDCGEGSCAVFHFYNPWLTRMGLARTTSLIVVLSGKQKLSLVELEMANNRGRSATVQGMLSNAHGSYDAHGKVPVGVARPMLSLDVRYTPDATVDQKKAALSFNTECLRSIKGCEFADEMLPQVQLQTPSR